MSLYDPEDHRTHFHRPAKASSGRQLAPHPARQVIENTAAIATRLKSEGGTVILVTVGFSPDYADAVNQPVDEPTVSRKAAFRRRHLRHQWKSRALAVDVHVVKHQWSAFYGTELDLQLRRRGIRTVILTGIATNFGVEATIRDAFAP